MNQELGTAKEARKAHKGKTPTARKFFGKTALNGLPFLRRALGTGGPADDKKGAAFFISPATTV
jgi:hypothetical protein